jgi:SAM-dependent methyltransferase
MSDLSIEDHCYKKWSVAALLPLCSRTSLTKKKGETMKEERYLDIVSHVETYLEKHGDSPQGHGWPKYEDAQTRYRVMLDVVKDTLRPASLLDFGCGTSLLYDYMLRHQINGIEYAGLDVSKKYLALSRSKFPHVPYYCLDVLKDDGSLPEFDYIVMNGVFTLKHDLPFEEMWDYTRKLVSKVWSKARIGMAFNVMSKHVDWEREDLFHLPFDTLAAFLKQEISRHFAFRHEYGLYEYTTYVYRSF